MAYYDFKDLPVPVKLFSVLVDIENQMLAEEFNPNETGSEDEQTLFESGDPYLSKLKIFKSITLSCCTKSKRFA